MTAASPEFPALSGNAAPSRPRISAVVLAAGLSTRMEGLAKLLLDAGGIPVIRRTVLNVLDFAPEETVVVTGHRAKEIEAELRDLPVRFAYNPDYSKGQPTSVASGVRALKAACDAVMVMPGDQPLVTARHMRDLTDAYATMGYGSILVPQHDGRRGNPILFAARHIPAVTAGGLNIGCRHLIETHGDQAMRIELPSDVFVTDCDTPEDYRRLRARLTAP